MWIETTVGAVALDRISRFQADIKNVDRYVVYLDTGAIDADGAVEWSELNGEYVSLDAAHSAIRRLLESCGQSVRALPCD